MIPARSLPIPDAPPPSSWQSFKTRLENWVLSVSQSFQAQILRQEVVTQVTPDAPVAGLWYGTVPFTIDTDTDGTPRAELVVDGVVQFHTAGALSGGLWQIQTVKVAGVDTVCIVLGAPPTTRVWFAFLVAR